MGLFGGPNGNIEPRYAGTGAWMGWVYTPFKPWIWNVNLAKYVYILEGQVTESGGWAYVPK